MSDAGFIATIDQMAQTGFEMLIFSFGSGFRLETADAARPANDRQRQIFSRLGLLLAAKGRSWATLSPR